MTYLESLVVFKCRELGVAPASEFFGVSTQLIRQWVAGSKQVSLAAVEKVFHSPEKGSERAAWEGKKVLLLLPWYKQTNPLTSFSIFGLLDREKMGVAMQFGDAFISHARNTLADRVIETGVPWGIFLDDDMVFPWGNAAWYRDKTGSTLPDQFAGVHTINRLLSRGKSLIGGLFYGRHPRGRAQYYEALQQTPEGDTENRRAHQPRDEVLATRSIATGCLLFNRQVLLDIRQKFPHLAPQHPSEPWHYFSNASDALLREFGPIQAETEALYEGVLAGTTDLTQVEAFLADTKKRISAVKRELLENNRLQSGEDFLFSHRAAAAGHQPHVDLSVVCAHIGTGIFLNHNTLEP